MDPIDLRILDVLIDDDEQLEEVFLGVNFRRQDNVFYMYRQTCRLADLVVRLRELEAKGWIRSRTTVGHAQEHGVAGSSYELTDQGRAVWMRNAPECDALYEVGNQPRSSDEAKENRTKGDR